MFPFHISLKSFYKAMIFSLFSAFSYKQYSYIQNSSEDQKISISYNPELSSELKNLLLSIANSLNYGSSQNKQLNPEEILIKNSLNEEKVFQLKNYSDIIRIQHFNSPPKKLMKEELLNVLDSLPQNEQVIIGFNTDDRSFNELRYGFVSNQAFFCFSDSEIKDILGASPSEIALIKRQSLHFGEKSNNFFKLNGNEFILNKFKIDDPKIKEKMLEFCLGDVEIIHTENEMINLLRMSKESQISKFLLYHPIEKNNFDLEMRRLKKFTNLFEKNEKIQVVYTKNGTLLSKFVNIIVFL